MGIQTDARTMFDETRELAGERSGINGTTLVNNGLIEHNMGIFYLATSAILQNYRPIQIMDDEDIQSTGTLGTIINFGYLAKTGGTGSSSVTAAIDSRPGSRIESHSGTMQISQSAS